MIRGKTIFGEDAESLIWIALFATPIAIGQVQMAWSAIRWLGSAVLELLG